jgi:predicted ATPase/class 3 adenylate cyclase
MSEQSMRELPRGTVTFLFTDIEGSTRLLHELGAERYAEELAAHKQVLREAFQRHDGVEVDTQGDAFFVAFPTAPGALSAASEAQETLELPVRMGLHTGTPLLTEEGYVGPDVHRAARIAAAGHGRQVLVSASTAALLETDGLRDLGEHRLKDLSAPERIYQLGDGEFPRLMTLYQTNLPVPATPFLGRESELAAVGELLAQDTVRLLTLTGAGGSGKTRLALQSVAAAGEEYPQGVWWVPLAEVSDPADVLPAAARALGGGGPLRTVIGDRRLLLLLDNFEHVVDAAADVAELLESCPRLDLVVTSRERLRITSEQVFPVPVLAREDARRLFVARARAAVPEFQPDEHVDELCARLDDLPLALELAAARTGLMSTAQLLERLGERLDLLRGGRDAEVRQRTLRATIEWSYGLLGGEEQEQFAALSVFQGGWTLESAERVCEADVEVLESLVDKNLVRRIEAGRLFMLETIREFAAEQLSPERREELLGRLLEALIETFEAGNMRPESPGYPAMELAQAERPNVDAALEWAVQAGEAAAGLHLMWMLETYWATNDPLGGRDRLEALLAAAREAIDPAVLARALRLRGATHDFTHEHALAEAKYERALEAFEAVGDDLEAGHIRHRLAFTALHQGDLERARRLASEALELDRRSGIRRDEALALNVLGMVAFQEGDPEKGVRLCLESASASASLDFIWFRGVTLLGAAEQLIAANDPETATPIFVEGVDALLSVQDRINLPIALAAGAAIAAIRNSPERAGMLWGAVEAAAEREPRGSTTGAVAEYEPYVEPVKGQEFEAARKRGTSLSLEEAAQYALSNLDSPR